MELWEAIEVYAAKQIDFTSEVIITNREDGTNIEWNLQGIVKPTPQQLNDLMLLEPLLKLRLDSHGFIYEIKRHCLMVEVEGYTIITINHSKIECNYFDIEYGLPLYKYFNNDIVLIEDPIEYQVDSNLWTQYSAKLQNEIMELLKTKSMYYMKDLYDVSPPYKQDTIYNCIHYFWSDKIPDWNVHLGFEVMIRLYAEKLYIENVENRQLTEDEAASFNAMLINMHNSNSMLKNYPTDPGPTLSTMNWYNVFLPQLNDASNMLRNYAFANRTYVCGR